MEHYQVECVENVTEGTKGLRDLEDRLINYISGIYQLLLTGYELPPPASVPQSLSLSVLSFRCLIFHFS